MMGFQVVTLVTVVKGSFQKPLATFTKSCSSDSYVDIYRSLNNGNNSVLGYLIDCLILPNSIK